MMMKKLVNWRGKIPDTFIFCDGGKMDSNYQFESDDCTVRALAIAFDQPYNVIYEFLARHGRLKNNSYTIWMLLNFYKKTGLFDCKITYIPFPTRRGVERMYVAAFCYLYPTGIYLLSSRNHISTCVDGLIYDTWWNPREIVYNAYKIEKE